MFPLFKLSKRVQIALKLLQGNFISRDVLVVSDPSTGRVILQQWGGLRPLEAYSDDVMIHYLGEHRMHSTPY